MEPRFYEGPTDWQKLFPITRFRYTMEPRYNEPPYNEVLPGLDELLVLPITNDFVWRPLFVSSQASNCASTRKIHLILLRRSKAFHISKTLGRGSIPPLSSCSRIWYENNWERNIVITTRQTNLFPEWFRLIFSINYFIYDSINCPTTILDHGGGMNLRKRPRVNMAPEVAVSVRMVSVKKA